ncbi:hypothetical protein BpHYR1_032157 [Brachionus plicatilis]|uniref:Uncharacterized protein n=1 Tax=Brachionus plicatilis TaxID=10195 RepID=A0A3M7QA65_BRAPC|nr:hypothetical protein BpHYR1_032157 [Brachionus plicatilis]
MFMIKAQCMNQLMSNSTIVSVVRPTNLMQSLPPILVESSISLIPDHFFVHFKDICWSIVVKLERY